MKSKVKLLRTSVAAGALLLSATQAYAGCSFQNTVPLKSLTAGFQAWKSVTAAMAECGNFTAERDQEFRKIGMQAAPALLAHRLGKYENKAQSLRALSNAGRRYLGQLQSEWLKDRNRRQTLRGLVK